MNITDVRIYKVENESEKGVKAYCSVVFDDKFVVNNIKIVNNNKTNKLLLIMPGKIVKGVYKDIAHPIKKDFREELEKAVLEKYEA